MSVSFCDWLQSVAEEMKSIGRDYTNTLSYTKLNIVDNFGLEFYNTNALGIIAIIDKVYF